MTPEQWERVYRQSFPHVYRALAATLMNGDVALDALHDAFVEGLRRPPEDLRNPEGWLYRVALRRARRSRSGFLRLFDRPARDREIEDVLDRDEVGRLLRRLTERQRAIVVAHYYLGRTHEEIAAELGISRGTVSATLSQSLARMREATDVA
jgi:RNA polymerase sigma-70 factor (ECF subfamily)